MEGEFIGFWVLALPKWKLLRRESMALNHKTMNQKISGAHAHGNMTTCTVRRDTKIDDEDFYFHFWHLSRMQIEAALVLPSMHFHHKSMNQ